MRLFLYYALHSFVNQIKKMFKTWVMIFMAACIVLGIVIGLIAGMVADHVSDSDGNGAQEEIVMEVEEEIPEGPSFWEIHEISKYDMVELIAGALILAIFVFGMMQADKNGSKIFLPADVNLLFPSPMKPQSVLMFRLATQLGVAVIGSVYMLFQLPNLVLNLELNMGGSLALIAAWGLTLIFGTLLQVLLYALASTYPTVKRYLRPVIYAVLFLIGGSFWLYWKSGDEVVLKAACQFFDSPASRLIPIWGWIKGFIRFAMDGEAALSLLCLGVLFAAACALIYLIWQIRVDFYEDAMAKSEETAALIERAQSEKNNAFVLANNKKDRSEKLKRDGMQHGQGANVFFFKTMYNRFRFAHLGFATTTMEFYLAAAVGVGAICRFLVQTKSVLPLILVLTALAFFRTLGNPLETDTKMDYFVMIPESTWAKLFWSLIGGSANCFLDMLLPLIVGSIVLGANPLTALGVLPLILSIDFYGTTVGVFIDLSVPVAAGKTLKQLVQIMFIYFGLLPDIAVIAFCFVGGSYMIGLAVATLINLLLGGLFFGLSPIFLDA